MCYHVHLNYKTIIALTFRFLKNTSFYNSKSYFTYFDTSFNNTPYISFPILTYNPLK